MKILELEVFDYIKCHQINYRNDPTQEKIATHFKVSKDRINKIIRILKKKNYIKIESGIGITVLK